MTTGIRTGTVLTNPTPSGVRGVPRLPNPNTPGWGTTPTYIARYDAAYNAIAVGGSVGTLIDPVGGLNLPVAGSPCTLTQAGNVLYLADTGGTFITATSLALTAPYALMCVVRCGAATVQPFALGNDGNNYVSFVAAGGSWLARTVSGGTVKTITSTVAPSSTAFQVLVMVVNGASSTFAVNGTEVTGDLGSASITAPVLIGKKFAADSYYRPQFATGGIYSGALTLAQRNMIYNSLRQRYGL